MRSTKLAVRGVTAVVSLLMVSCSSAKPDTGDTEGAHDSGAQSVVTADGGPSNSEAGSPAGGSAVTETGTIVDYETLDPLAGFTVTDNGVSATTDANGHFSLSVPASVTLLQPTVTGPSYTLLLFPRSTPAGSVANYGSNVIPSSSTYSLEQTILGNDQTKALVQIVALTSGSCATAVGGSVQVVSPAGTSVSYFSTENIPDSSLTSFQAVQSPRAVAVVYNVPVGAQLTLAVTHPTCTLAPFPVESGGMMMIGQVTTQATEPGDVNSALVLMLQ
jgi:hypothetical protein